jgi:hypothetical protein
MFNVTAMLRWRKAMIWGQNALSLPLRFFIVIIRTVDRVMDRHIMRCMLGIGLFSKWTPRSRTTGFMIFSYNFKEWSLHWHFSVCVASKLCPTRRILLLHVLGTVTFCYRHAFYRRLEYHSCYLFCLLKGGHILIVIFINLIYWLTSLSTRPRRNQHEKTRAFILGRHCWSGGRSCAGKRLFDQPYIAELPLLHADFHCETCYFVFCNPARFGRLILSMGIAGWVTGQHVRGRQLATSSSIVENDLLYKAVIRVTIIA